ncbi:hypothetical protein GLOIN_2v1885597 [Rhizophagus clarus]|uniref:Uncharacterized protein n=1 Tax=Rhizophagus clarus TaxID=94130 RepID=A0A8H3QYT6_9GLOM|nr:hypothetical protein GLOIN_2v1885597 [Rhizophagus clarus]
MQFNKTEAVSELRKAIKKENTQAFANIDAKDIEEENEKLDLSAKTNVSIKEKLGGYPVEMKEVHCTATYGMGQRANINCMIHVGSPNRHGHITTAIFIVNISPNQDVIGLTTDSNIDLPSYEDKTCIHVTNANEATRREYISPVLHGVVSCDDDKVKVCPEYELSGSYGKGPKITEKNNTEIDEIRKKFSEVEDENAITRVQGLHDKRIHISP